MYQQDVIQSQSEALSQFSSKNESGALRQLQDLESAALATAIASSEYDAAQRDAELKSKEIASQLQSQEISEADQELATVLETSERDAVQEEVSRTRASSALGLKRSREQERNEGTWDCAQCTFTNQPYRQICSVCGNEAPPNVLTFEELATLRFGLEIEIIVPLGKSDGYTLETIADNLTAMSPVVEFVGYTHVTSQHWKIVTDRSLQGGEDDLCFELVSPVLQGEDGLDELRIIMENIRRLGIATNTSCGFHVHVDATRSENGEKMGTLAGLKRVAQCFVALENAFDLLVSRTWNNQGRYHRRANHNEFCRSNRLAFGSMSNRQRWEDIDSVTNRHELVELINPTGDRYMKLNLTKIANPSRPSTCEFRHHGGVEELKEAEAWVRLVLRFCQQASKHRSSSMGCLLPEGSTPKGELAALLNLVNCSGLEQYYVVERRLFPNLSLQNTWSCGECGNSFASSRDLSQHTQATGHA